MYNFKVFLLAVLCSVLVAGRRCDRRLCKSDSLIERNAGKQEGLCQEENLSRDVPGVQYVKGRKKRLGTFSPVTIYTGDCIFSKLIKKECIDPKIKCRLRKEYITLHYQDGYSTQCTQSDVEVPVGCEAYVD